MKGLVTAAAGDVVDTTSDVVEKRKVAPLADVEAVVTDRHRGRRLLCYRLTTRREENISPSITTVIVLVSYYVFVIKCWRGSGILRRLLSSAYSRRRGRHYMPPVVHTMATEVRGLETSVMRAIPIIKYTKARGDQRPFFHECAVCLSEFQEEERLKLLPNCSHGFHIDCVDTWLQFNARCPLCRSEVTSTAHLKATDHVVVLPHRQDQLGENMVTQVRDEVSNQTPGATAAAPSPSTRKKGRKHLKAGSLGDECIDVRSEKEEQFHVQLVRRSVSMDSSNDRQLYVSVQEILRQNPHHLQEAGSSSSGRIRRRPFFSFSWSTRSWALAVKIDA
ncbi:hypothetical protein BHM03_00021287 [Ensete ventricosum]|uniref:RING-type E3 ubiquitin transferase n=1 Tax=Ensete ventricosum TaxID=4639 RepID=A0A445MG04_ENSVE|nr:hypothetical protein BHM03_00021287 [Ensete ventricosum]